MSRGLTLALSVAGALLALLLLLPLGGLVWRALSDGDVAAELGSGATWNALRLSLITATITAVIAVLLGTPLALAAGAQPHEGGPPRGLAARSAAGAAPHGRGHRAADRVRAQRLPRRRAWRRRRDALLHHGGGGAGAALRLSPVLRALRLRRIRRRTDPRFEGVAYTLGLSRWRTFRSVTLPLVWPSLAGGAVLCWARALGELGATLLFAGSLPGRTQTMPLAILAAFESEAGIAGAVSLSVVLLGFAAVLLLALHRVTASAGAYR